MIAFNEHLTSFGSSSKLNAESLNMNTVWVPQTTEKNIDAARKFGQIEVILLKDHALESSVDTLTRTLLTESKPDDYLLMIGSPLYIAVSYHALMTAHGKAKVLQWDRKQLKYIVIEIER